MSSKDSNTFIVKFWSNIFFILGKISVFSLVRLIPKLKTNSLFSEIWALGHLFLSILFIPFSLHINNNVFLFSISVYGLLRVFEIFVYQTNVLLFDEYRAKNKNKSYALNGYRRIVILLIQNYFEIIFWFASLYLIFANNFIFSVEGSSESILGAIYTSFQVMTSFGFSNISPSGMLAYSLLIGETVIGLFMTLLSLARFIALLPIPNTKDRDECSYIKYR